MKQFICFALLSLFVFINPLQSAHIISGTMAYKCIGDGEYEITMIIYRDCFGGGADFDLFAPVTAYNNGELVADFQVPLLDSETVTFFPYEDCDPTGPEVCVEQGTYVFTANLPISNEEYTLAYQRCCWAASVTNIDTPEERGITVTTAISPLAQTVCNSQNLIEFPLTFTACPGETVSIPLDLFDEDGDSLSYDYCFPLEGGGIGGTPNNPSTDPLACDGVAPNPACAPPYNEIPYAQGFNPENPFPTEDGISFNPTTGAMEFVPTTIGRFVYGLCVTEYRNGQILGVYQQSLEVVGVVNSITSTEEQRIPLSWEIYYSPATDQLHLNREGDTKQAHFVLYNLSGQMMLHQKKEQANRAMIDTQELGRGIYLLHIEEANATQVLKVMIY